MAVWGRFDRDPTPTELDPGRGDSGAGPGAGSFTEDPPNRYDGMFWVRSDLLELRFQVGGNVYAVTLSAGGGGGPYAAIGEFFLVTQASSALTNETVLDPATLITTSASAQTKVGDFSAGGFVKGKVRLRVEAQGANPADPPSGEADLLVINSGTGIFRIRYNQGGIIRTADVALA